MSGRTLLEHLRAQDDATLGALLRARPDLAMPAPADTGVVATRASVRLSVGRAAEQLDGLALAVLDALLVARADEQGAPVDDVIALLGVDVTPARAREGLDRLTALALAWTDAGGEVVRAVPALREVSVRYPAGLGRPAPAFSTVATADDPRAVVASRPDDERAVLEALSGQGPVGRSRASSGADPGEHADRGPVARLLADGLLVRLDAETVELTREAGIGVRGDRPLGEVAVHDPMPAPRSQDPDTVDATAAGEILELVRRAEQLLTAWGAAPPSVLRSGGLGVRDLRRAGRDLGLDETGAALLVDVLAAAGLIAVSEDGDPGRGAERSRTHEAQWVPTTAVDAWLAAAPETRWVTLARGWLDSPRAPSLVGERDSNDKLVGPLSDESRRPWAVSLRRRVLARLAELDEGAGADADDLVASLAWRAPRRGGPLRDRLARDVVREATSLGLVALGALTSPARELLAVPRDPADDPGRAAAAALRPALPAPVDHVLLQADLTAVAPGRLEPELAAAMERVADVESAGGATVYRISERTIRRALDRGMRAEEIHELFTTRSATPVPQGLAYLVDDVARRHGRLRVGTAASFVRAEDEALLAEVLARPEAERLELHRLAPTVLVSSSPLADVLAVLREAGLSPVAEDAGGEVLDLRPTGRRTAVPRGARGGGGTDLSDDQITALVAQMRAGDRTSGGGGRNASTVPGSARATTSATVAVLTDAATHGRTVWIGYVDAQGSASQRVVRPCRVGGGVLEGVEADPGDESGDGGASMTFALHRITSVSVLAER